MDPNHLPLHYLFHHKSGCYLEGAKNQTVPFCPIQRAKSNVCFLFFSQIPDWRFAWHRKRFSLQGPFINVHVNVLGRIPFKLIIMISTYFFPDLCVCLVCICSFVHGIITLIKKYELLPPHTVHEYLFIKLYIIYYYKK